MDVSSISLPQLALLANIANVNGSPDSMKILATVISDTNSSMLSKGVGFSGDFYALTPTINDLYLMNDTDFLSALNQVASQQGTDLTYSNLLTIIMLLNLISSQ
jgi:hypothetical protein